MHKTSDNSNSDTAVIPCSPGQGKRRNDIDSYLSDCYSITLMRMNAMERGKLDGNVYTGADSGNAMDSGDHEPGLTALGLDTETRIGGSIPVCGRAPCLCKRAGILHPAEGVPVSASGGRDRRPDPQLDPRGRGGGGAGEQKSTRCGDRCADRGAHVRGYLRNDPGRGGTAVQGGAPWHRGQLHDGGPLPDPSAQGGASLCSCVRWESSPQDTSSTGSRRCCCDKEKGRME